MRRAISLQIVVLLSLQLTLGCDDAPQTAVEVVSLPYKVIGAAAADPAENGPGDDTRLAAVVPGRMKAVMFPHFKHASNKKGGFGIPCQVCHHTFEAGQDPDSGCAGCHKAPPTEKTDPAHSGPDDNLMLIGKDQDTSKVAPVIFNHFTHASADGHNIGCDTCHHTQDRVRCADCHEKVAKKVEGDDGTPKIMPKAKRAFHESCKGCHESLKKNQPNSPAPTDCAECHNTIGPRRMAGALHINRAYHISCNGCHNKVRLVKQDSKAPILCTTCHNAGRKKVKKKKVVKPKVEGDAGPSAASGDAQDMGPEEILIDHAKKVKSGTPFNHKKHQELGDDCDECHHKGLEDPTCRTCHNTVQEAKKAYHGNCIPCHKERGIAASCKTCHP